ncbi:hypothetical protein QEH52_05780 [Coraliomargarita sp. SDUM461003]|uniref:SMP domain-containing protein n=1 Tax=Thalassobacterium maritimum TaxID=3041265 RepID=A0ABU1AVJ9_9BACT|nr:hypothetical protein [Coraliomargarita sp. SDUM461003]MDQ8207007.1 hypothetical protein [Coraliomargarita sp. SDUM461003]
MANKGKTTAMTPTRASAIQSAAARSNGGKVSKGTFATRAQSAAARGKSK